MAEAMKLAQAIDVGQRYLDSEMGTRPRNFEAALSALLDHARAERDPMTGERLDVEQMRHELAATRHEFSEAMAEARREGHDDGYNMALFRDPAPSEDDRRADVLGETFIAGWKQLNESSRDDLRVGLRRVLTWLDGGS